MSECILEFKNSITFLVERTIVYLVVSILMASTIPLRFNLERLLSQDLTPIINVEQIKVELVTS